MTRYVNACKIPIFLSYCPLSNLDPVLNYNITNCPKLLLDNNKKNIGLKVLYNGKKEIKSADMDNDKWDIRSANINKQNLATQN